MSKSRDINKIIQMNFDSREVLNEIVNDYPKTQRIAKIKDDVIMKKGSERLGILIRKNSFKLLDPSMGLSNLIADEIIGKND